MRFKNEEYSITNVMPTNEGNVQGICISRKALEKWKNYCREKAKIYCQAGHRDMEINYAAQEAVLIQILQHFEEEEV